mgnify:CR=1 FL=1
MEREGPSKGFEGMGGSSVVGWDGMGWDGMGDGDGGWDVKCGFWDFGCGYISRVHVIHRNGSTLDS